MPDPQDRSVFISVPPRTEFIALLRTVTGGVATRMELPLDAIDDLRLAVDEAMALLLTASRGASRIEMRLDPTDAELIATVARTSRSSCGLPSVAGHASMAGHLGPHG